MGPVDCVRFVFGPTRPGESGPCSTTGSRGPLTDNRRESPAATVRDRDRRGFPVALSGPAGVLRQRAARPSGSTESGFPGYVVLPNFGAAPSPGLRAGIDDIRRGPSPYRPRGSSRNPSSLPARFGASRSTR